MTATGALTHGGLDGSFGSGLAAGVAAWATAAGSCGRRGAVAVPGADALLECTCVACIAVGGCFACAAFGFASAAEAADDSRSDGTPRKAMATESFMTYLCLRLITMASFRQELSLVR